jgi:hypothetical protein
MDPTVGGDAKRADYVREVRVKVEEKLKDKACARKSSVCLRTRPSGEKIIHEVLIFWAASVKSMCAVTKVEVSGSNVNDMFRERWEESAAEGTGMMCRFRYAIEFDQQLKE